VSLQAKVPKKMTGPDGSTAASSPGYLAGELLADDMAFQWQGLYARRLRTPRVVDRSLVPATPEPHISCTLKGTAEFRERDTGGAWITRQIRPGDLFVMCASTAQKWISSPLRGKKPFVRLILLLQNRVRSKLLFLIDPAPIMKSKKVAVLAAVGACTFSSFGQTIYEAEVATLSGPSVASSNGGYTRSGYADYNNASGDYVEFALNASSAGNYPIAFRYANGGATDRPLQLSVNGVTVVASLSFPPTGGWTTWLYAVTNNVTFNAGLNKVRITAIGSSGGNVDHMLVTVNGTSAPQPVTYNFLSAPFRRPVSPSQPMWLVHIDTWNSADPQKIIDLVPVDIRPYVVMNISLSISHDTNIPSRFNVVEYGYETAKSWIRTCAQNQMWCMVQPSSGGFSHLSDFDMSVSEEFFRDYPNFLGFNYTEQFWGFDSTTDPLSAKWVDRINHFADLLPLCSKYGGYLVVGWCGNQYDPNINPIGMLKRNANFAAACQKYSKNYILEEKYTQQGYQSDMESLCLGAYLSGYSGNYGIRWDETGWTDGTGVHTNFTMASAGPVHLEHMLMSGATVIDAPELIWQQDFRELSAGATDNGYTMRRWSTFQQFDNEMVDLFRKVIDGTVRIPTRQEAISRTRYVIINDVNSGTADNQYSSPQDLFMGLYKLDNDGSYVNDKNVYKKTGRYPTVPVVYQLNPNDTLAQTFQFKINRSAYSSRWPSITAKTNEMNTYFPSEYTGDLYARRIDNNWVIYNPYRLIGVTASNSIPFRYNTCDHVDLVFSEYSASILNESSNQVKVYIANYDSQVNTARKTDTITIYGASAQPTFSWTDRTTNANRLVSILSSSWSSGAFTLTVQHNGSIDITINCAGIGTGRLNSFTPATLIVLDKPLLFPGPRQHEGEQFEYKNISGVTKNGYSGSLRNYTGQGYINFGTGSTAAARKWVNVLKSGTYRLETRYSVGANISTIGLYVNGIKVAAPTFTSTAGDWGIVKTNINLNASSNSIEFRGSVALASAIYFDNLVVVPTMHGDGVVIEENTPGFVGVDGTIDTNFPGYSGDGFANTFETNGASTYWSLYFDSSAVKSFAFRYASTNDGAADLLLNGTNIVANIQFPSTGSYSNWDFVSVYAYAAPGAGNLRLQSTSSNGLPNIDSLELIGGNAIPQPHLSVASLVDKQLALQVNGVGGLKFQVQSSTNLADWATILTTNSPPMPFIWTNNISGSTKDFFRVLATPPF